MNIVRKLLEMSVRPEFIEGFLRTARSYFDQAQHERFSREDITTQSVRWNNIISQICFPFNCRFNNILKHLGITVLERLTLTEVIVIISR